MQPVVDYGRKEGQTSGWCGVDGIQSFKRMHFCQVAHRTYHGIKTFAQVHLYYQFIWGATYFIEVLFFNQNILLNLNLHMAFSSIWKNAPPLLVFGCHITEKLTFDSIWWKFGDVPLKMEMLVVCCQISCQRDRLTCSCSYKNPIGHTNNHHKDQSQFLFREALIF